MNYLQCSVGMHIIRSVYRLAQRSTMSSSLTPPAEMGSPALFVYSVIKYGVPEFQGGFRVVDTSLLDCRNRTLIRHSTEKISNWIGQHSMIGCPLLSSSIPSHRPPRASEPPCAHVRSPWILPFRRRNSLRPSRAVEPKEPSRGLYARMRPRTSPA